MIDFFLLLRYKKREEEVYQELIELQEQEREILYEWGGSLTALQGHMDDGVAPEERLPLTRQEKAELRQKLEDTSNLQEQVGPLSQPFLTNLTWQHGISPLVCNSMKSFNYKK
jgi:hypothetical protein